MPETLDAKPEEQHGHHNAEKLVVPSIERAPSHHHEKDPAETLIEARTNVAEMVQAENSPDPLEKLQAAENASRPATPTYINRELKQITLKRELKYIRRKLPVVDRQFSKFIHQPAVRVVSETAGKTFSRPSGLLGGGLVALIGTSGYLYLAKHLGFKYNYAVFLVLFAGGFVVGLLLELVVHLATASRRKANN